MGKNYVENSLKRFLKRKVKITMGFVVAFMIMGTGAFGAATEISGEMEGSKIKGEQIAVGDLIVNGGISGANLDLSSNDLVIKANGAFSAISGGKIINGNKITIISNEENSFHGIYADGGKVNMSANSINIKANYDGIYSTSGSNSIINIETDDLNITAGIYGILSDSGSNIYIKGKNSETSSLTINSIYDGIALRNANTNFNKTAGNIEVKDFDSIKIISKANGILLKKWNSTEGLESNAGKIVLKANSIDITGEKNGILLQDGNKLEDGKHSTIDIQGNNVTITSTNKEKQTAISIGKGGTINLNTETNTGSLKVNGDIIAQGNEILEGTANINFKTSDSILNGKIETGELNSATNIEFSNKAQWNNTGDSKVTNLTFDNGIINNTSAENGIAVENLKGNGGEINMAAAINEKGEAVSGKIEIGKIENNNAHFDINYKGDDNLEVSQEKAKEVFDKLTDNITVGEGELKADVKLEEGFVKGGYTADLTVDKNGSQIGTIDYELNSMVEGMRDLATINLLTWRQEMNSLNKRMGELRNSTGEHGVWSRVYTGKIENGSKYDNDYQTYQVGYDKKYTVDNGVMFVGGLVSYTDGETDYALGHGENYSVGAGIYATWLNNDGQFADVVLKQSRLHNKFDVRSKDLDKSQSGDYNNWGTSLSGQYGKRFDLNDKFFLEPSVELTLGRVEDTTYTTSAGVDVHQDTMYSLVGNVGTSVGYKFSDKGNVYARAALVKEFQGDIDTEYEKDGALERTSEDLGDTWAEFGVGVNYRFVENMNVYVDVQKTGEATVDNKWQANLGFRYEF